MLNLTYTTKPMSLYDIVVSEESHLYSAFMKNTKLYWSILTVTVAGIWVAATANYTNNQILKDFSLILGGVMIILEMRIAIVTLKRLYKRLLETIAYRAMVEKELGLTELSTKNKSLKHKYWASSPLVPLNQIEYREKFNSSKEFIDQTYKNSFSTAGGFSGGSICSSVCDLFIKIKYLAYAVCIGGAFHILFQLFNKFLCKEF